MNQTTGMQQGVIPGGVTPPRANRTYVLPENGFPKYARSLVLQMILMFMFMIALAILTHFIVPAATWTHIARFSAFVLAAALFYLPLLIRQQKKLWQKVVVVVGDGDITVYHGDGWMPDLHLLPQRQVRLAREQVTTIREKAYGLALATRYDPEALVIPIHLEAADYREVVRTLSFWSPIQHRPVNSVESKIARLRQRLAKAMEIAGRKPQFYERGLGAIECGGLLGVLAGTIPGLLAAIEWSKGQAVIPTNLAWIIVAGFIINIFVTILATQVALAWIDYGLARAGVSRPARSAIWIGLAAAVPISLFALTGGAGVAASLVVFCALILVAAGVAWLEIMLQIKTETTSQLPAVIVRDPADYAAMASSGGQGAGDPIRGTYRLTAEEFLTAFGYCNLTQPRSHGKPRPIAAWLPRSVEHKVAEAAFESHPRRNAIMRFSIDRAALRWQAGELKEQSSGWEQIRKVIRTPKGFLLVGNRPGFDWIPLHAFFAVDGAKAFAGLARSHTSYSEII